jgi:hypothetical protein
MTRSSESPRNLLDLKPVRHAAWEKTEEGTVVLLIPKFRGALLARWLQPRLTKPNFRVKLDRLGSFVWERCDGATRVEAIGEEMRREFGDSAEPVFDRIGTFIRKLEKEKFLLIS